ncbi:hypothetical protein ACOME3_010777, partial [Neoechinorhynchus agilis]
MSYTSEALPIKQVFTAVETLKDDICSILCLPECALTPLSFRQLMINGTPINYLVKTSVTQKDCCDHSTICILKIRI